MSVYTRGMYTRIRAWVGWCVGGLVRACVRARTCVRSREEVRACGLVTGSKICLNKKQLSHASAKLINRKQRIN